MTITRIPRRALLVQLGAAIAAVPLARLVGACADGPLEFPITATDEATAGDAAAPRASGAATWATGGTAAMTAKALYPNPFAVGSIAPCALTGALTPGRCYNAQSLILQDISYGQPGLPMRMVLQVLNSACTPVSGVVVEVWHAAPTGKYSGIDTLHEDVALCTGGDPDYASHLYFRGKQTTDTAGLVTFDTVFPGWIEGRTVHVSFTVTSGAASFTSQFVFDDALTDFFIASQPIYNARGPRSTTNTNDSVVTQSNCLLHQFATKQLPDGALLAWKSIVLSG